MWICRFEIKNILLFHFRITVLWKFLNEFRLAKELDVTATIFSSYKLPLYNLNPWIVVYMNRYFMFIHLQFNFCNLFFARGDFNFDWLFFIKLFWWNRTRPIFFKICVRDSCRDGWNVRNCSSNHVQVFRDRWSYKLVMDEMYEIGWFVTKFEHEYSRICVVSVLRAQTLCKWWNPRWCSCFGCSVCVGLCWLFGMYDSKN